MLELAVRAAGALRSKNRAAPLLTGFSARRPHESTDEACEARTDAELIVLANREPYRHERDRDGRLAVSRSSSGVVNAVEPLLLRALGVWVAEGVGDADRRAASIGTACKCRPTIAALSPAPRLVRPSSSSTATTLASPTAPCGRSVIGRRSSRCSTPARFHAYELVNRRFADAVAEEAVGAVAGGAGAGLSLRAGAAVHSPPAAAQPHRDVLAHSVAAAGDICALPVEPHAARRSAWQHAYRIPDRGGSRSTSSHAVEQLLQRRRRSRRRHRTYKGRRVVGRRVSGVDRVARPSGPTRRCQSASAGTGVPRVLSLDANAFLGVGVDRLDYTKGIEQKFLAIEWLLERRPRSGRPLRVRAARRAEPRMLPPYRHTRARVLETAVRINRRFSSKR